MSPHMSHGGKGLSGYQPAWTWAIWRNKYSAGGGAGRGGTNLQVASSVSTLRSQFCPCPSWGSQSSPVPSINPVVVSPPPSEKLHGELFWKLAIKGRFSNVWTAFDKLAFLVVSSWQWVPALCHHQHGRAGVWLRWPKCSQSTLVGLGPKHPLDGLGSTCSED